MDPYLVLSGTAATEKTTDRALIDRNVGVVLNALVILVSVTNAAGQPVTGVSIDFMPTCTVRTALRPA